MTKSIQAGDFTGLADDYARNRPNYSPSVRDGLVGLLGKRVCDVDFVDVGAGTGIWTRMINELGMATVTAVEPNDDMRAMGVEDSRERKITWLSGTAEKTNLSDGSADWVTMASSFHWAKFDKAIAEFHRVLRDGGRFTALWNPRLIEVNPLLVEIEEQLQKYQPNLKRVSSGRSGITEVLTDRLLDSNLFEDVVYLEGRHVLEMSPERYLGAWRSVNDLRVQLGPENFDDFLAFVEDRVSDLRVIEATYLTRAWSALRKN